MSRTKRNHAAATGFGRAWMCRRRWCRDHKPWFKPPKWYKAMKQRIRRARDNDAIRQGREPEWWRKTNVWEWT